MSLDALDYNLLMRVNRSIQDLGQQAGHGVPLSVYNELLGRYDALANNLVGLREDARRLQASRDEWQKYGESLEAAFNECKVLAGKLKAERNGWEGQALDQKARAERAEAELARLRGLVGPKAA